MSEDDASRRARSAATLNVVERYYCPKCREKSVTVYICESSCGGYEDAKYECANCDHYWWVDGPDS